jgi:drug/metabolite transporter (DMT)-like permease
MVSAVFVPGLAIAVMTALQAIAQKHVAHKLSHKTAFVIAALGYFVLTLFYIGYHKEFLQKDLQNIIVPTVLILLGSVLLGFAANLLFFSILKHDQISVVSALTSTVPVFVAGFSFLILKETLSYKQIAGIASVVGGLVLLS